MSWFWPTLRCADGETCTEDRGPVLYVCMFFYVFTCVFSCTALCQILPDLAQFHNSLSYNPSLHALPFMSLDIPRSSPF